MIRPYSASYKCARELIARGCPLDFLGHLPGSSSGRRKRLYVHEVGGYAESRIFDHGAGANTWVVPIVIGTDLSSGVVIDNWDFAAADQQYISWGYDPCELIPKYDLPAYLSLVNSRLSGVLDERRLLVRGRPVAGLLCGVAEEPIKPTVTGGTIPAVFSVTDDTGFTVKRQIAFTVDRHLARVQAAPNGSKASSVKRPICGARARE